MSSLIISYEPQLRLFFFIAALTLVALWEIRSPRRRSGYSKSVRWFNNLAIVALNTLVVRLVFPVMSVGVALYAEQQQWGLLSYLQYPGWVTFLLALLLLDLAIYLQHLMFHAVPLFWRFHRMHHTDLDYDVTTGARFHPLEIIVSMLIKMAVVVVIGPPAAAVVVFEVLLNITAMFNHGNICIPPAIDRWLRWLVVTPDMHRVHHSVIREETDSNYGFNLPWWDRLLGTYRAQPKSGHTEMTIGLRDFRDPADLRLHRMLIQPFAKWSVGEEDRE